MSKFGQLIIVLLTLSVICPLHGKALQILMLGNSYTDAGSPDQQVWLQLQNYLNADPEYSGTKITRSTPGGWQLYDHAKSEKSLSLIKGFTAWDFVILQDQSYTPSHAWLYGGAWRDRFLGGIESLTRLSKEQGAKVIYYETWARASGEKGILATDYHGDPAFMQKNLTAAYRYAADKFDAQVAPVGESWEISLQLSPAMTLHQGDLSHMNNRGAYLAAVVLYHTITGKDPSTIKYTSSLSQTEANTLRANFTTFRQK